MPKKFLTDVSTNNLVTPNTTFNLVNDTATTVNIAGAATTLNFGAATGTCSIKNPTITTGVTTGTLALFNTGLTGILNIGGATGTINIGDSTTGKVINIGTSTTSANSSLVRIGTAQASTTSDILLQGAIYAGKVVSGTGNQIGYNPSIFGSSVTATGTTGNATAGTLAIYAGDAILSNANNITGNATSGSLVLDAGNSQFNAGSPIYGTVSVGTFNASTVTIGKSGSATAINGTTTMGGQLNAVTGTSSIAPIKLTAGTVLGTPAYGVIEATSDVIYLTNNPGTTSTGAGRGIIHANQMVFSQANSANANSTTPVNIFASTNDVLSVLEPNKLYRFRAKYYSAFNYGGVAAAINILFAFSAAPTSTKYTFRTYPQSTGTATTSQGVITTNAASTIVPSPGATSGTWVTEIDGYFTTHATTASTLTPQFACNLSAGGSTATINTGSWFEIEKLGASTATNIAGNWA
jgi:hypothetical protein